ncbi:MAG TPA: hypothetical protein VFI62_11425, partial [Burkholderiales bacterium]|nr:hypothetical protein [Burkholderiales bacterium]
RIRAASHCARHRKMAARDSRRKHQTRELIGVLETKAVCLAKKAFDTEGTEDTEEHQRSGELDLLT